MNLEFAFGQLSMLEKEPNLHFKPNLQSAVCLPTDWFCQGDGLALKIILGETVSHNPPKGSKTNSSSQSPPSDLNWNLKVRRNDDVVAFPQSTGNDWHLDRDQYACQNTLQTAKESSGRLIWRSLLIKSTVILPRARTITYTEQNFHEFSFV